MSAQETLMDRIGLLLCVFGLGVTFAVCLPEAVEAQVPARDASIWSAVATPPAPIRPRSLPLQGVVRMPLPGGVALGADFGGVTDCMGSDEYVSLCRFLLLGGSAMTDVVERALGSFAEGYGPPEFVRSSPVDMLVPLIDSFWPCGQSNHGTLRPGCRYEGLVAPETRIAAGLFGSFAGYLLSRVAEAELGRTQVDPKPGPGLR
jgi:hypothetical protein